MGRARVDVIETEDTAAAVLGVVPNSVGPGGRRPGVIGRDDLVKRLLDAREGQVVVVAAPAGYGKSTLVQLWSEVDVRPFAWVGVDHLDDDPGYLVRHIAAALDRVERVDHALVRTLNGVGRSVDTDLVPALGRHLDRRAPFVLVVDDVHVLRAPAALRALDGVMAHVPEGSQLALVGRSIPALRLARRRLQGQVVEVDATDLAMGPVDAARVFDLAGLDLDDDTIDRLVVQTEGWPGGLHLAALALQPLERPARAGAFSGRHRLVGDFLVEEVLDGLDPDTVRFLMQSAILDRMSGPLLDELLDRDRSGGALAAIEQSGNLLLVPLDDERQWYRYHHLFGEMLRARLWSTEPAEARRLHQRASALFERRGDIDAAVRYAVAADDRDRAAALTLAQAPQLVLAGGAARLGQWLDLLGEHAVDTDARVALASAWYALGVADRDRLLRSVLAAERAGWDGPLPDGSPSLATALAMLRVLVAPDGVPGVLRDAEVVRAAGPPASNSWWGLAVGAQGTAWAMLGDTRAATEAIEAGIGYVEHLPAFAATARAHLALLALDRGDLDDADRHIALTNEILERHNLEELPAAVGGVAIRALVAALRGRPDEARRTALAARRLLARLEGISPRTAVLSFVVLARAASALGDLADARTLVAEGQRARARDGTATHLNEQLDELQQQLDSGLMRPSTAIAPVTSAELRVLAYLPTHLSMQEIADELVISRNTVKSHAVAIYRKLGAASRSDAVTRARELGLLDI